MQHKPYGGLPDPIKGRRCDPSTKQLTSVEKDHTPLTDWVFPARDPHGKLKISQERNSVPIANCRFNLLGSVTLFQSGLSRPIKNW